jgi:hypothetical protein
MVVKNCVVYVADMETPNGPLGTVDKYNLYSGKYLGSLKPPSVQGVALSPRGVVFGLDGKLYVTSFGVADSETDKILVFSSGTSDDISQHKRAVRLYSPAL